MYYSIDSLLYYSTISSVPRVCTLVLFHYTVTACNILSSSGNMAISLTICFFPNGSAGGPPRPSASHPKAWDQTPRLPLDHVAWDQTPRLPLDHVAWDQTPRLPLDHVAWDQTPRLPLDHVAWDQTPRLPLDHVAWDQTPDNNTCNTLSTLEIRQKYFHFYS